MHPALFRLLAFCAVIGVARAQTPGTQLWTSEVAPIAAPAVSPNGQVIALTATAVVALNRDGNEAWRVAFTPGNPFVRPVFPSPPVIDAAGNIYVVGQTELLALSPAGTRRWNHLLRLPVGGYVSVAAEGRIVLKNYTNRVAFTSGGQALWTLDEPLVGNQVNSPPVPSSSPIVVAPDGTLRNVISNGDSDIRSVDQTLLARELSFNPEAGGPSEAMLLGIGLNAESLIASRTLSGSFELRWTRSDGLGSAATARLPRITDPTLESLGYGLCGPSGEVFLVTSAGTLAVPHQGIGYRRWAETAFAITSAGEVLCWNGASLLARGSDHAVKWTAPAPGTFFTLSGDGRVYGGTRLSAYHLGAGPAAGPWPLPRADPAHRARALSPFPPSSATLQFDAPATVTFYESYEGVIAPRVYASGPATLRWEKDGADFAAADAEGNLNIPAVSPAHAGVYRLRVQNARGVTYSPEIRVAVNTAAPVRPGLYSGSLTPDGRTPFLLEITGERYVRFLAAEGPGVGQTTPQRLDPTGGYSDGNDSGLRLQSDATGVTLTWNRIAQRPAPAPAALPSGARVGWYFGKPFGLAADFAEVKFALVPNGSVFGTIAGSRFSVVNRAVSLDSATLRPSAQISLRNTQGSMVGGAVSFDFDREGRVRFSTLTASGQREEFYAAMSDVAPGRIANLSARASAGDAERTLTGGFVVETRGQFLVRGIGPALASFGVSSALPTPSLELRRSSGELLTSNRGWSTTPNAATIASAAQQSGAFTLPAGSADSAILMMLEPGAYTASVTGRPAGDALLELYAVPVTDAPPARTINLSTLARVSSPGERVIVGLVVQADLAQPVLLRAVGPGLRTFLGENAPVAENPRLRVYDAQGVLFAGNNDWRTAWQPTPDPESLLGTQSNTLSVAAGECGAFPLTEPLSRDAALLLSLPSGAYTVHLDTEDGGGGAVLFEAYAVPKPK